MLEYPSIDPIAFSCGPLQIRWYGITYVLGILGAWLLLQYRRAFPPDVISDLIFYAVVGIIAGGRIGYFVFYEPSQFWENPLEIPQIWHPGMSFHGGMIGVLIAMVLFARRYQYPWLLVTDRIAPVVPIGLGLGRIGNFINGELWGRVSHMPWSMVVPHAGPWPRHPSPLYACALEGILLFCILWVYSLKPRPRGQVSALFLCGYGTIRFIDEFFREPDFQHGFIAWGWLTMGQLLCLPMIGMGLWLWQYSSTRNPRE
jgi:phosphatidylglycerol:prolipoprotein diacylglycerol transferase